MEKIEEGTIIEIKVPNVEKPIKAVVLDVIAFPLTDLVDGVELICYAQKRIFKVYYKCIRTIKKDEKGNAYTDYEYYGYNYEGIIVDYCEIPSIPSDI